MLDLEKGSPFSTTKDSERLHALTSFYKARQTAITIFESPIWTGKTSEHEYLRQRWFRHGQGLAMFETLLALENPYFVGNIEEFPARLLGGFVHDLAKPDVIAPPLWNKPLDQFTPQERRALERHTIEGINRLAYFEKLTGTQQRDVTLARVLLHHEKFDGSGFYNFTLAELPWQLRIFILDDQIVSRVEDDRLYQNGRMHPFPDLISAFNDVQSRSEYRDDQEILEQMGKAIVAVNERLHWVTASINQEEIKYWVSADLNAGLPINALRI